MPTYVYRCDNDDCPNATAFEVQHSMTDSFEGYPCDEKLDVGHADMEECNGGLRRVYTPIPAHFKGGGWAKMTEWKAKGS